MLNAPAQHHRRCVQDICWQNGRPHLTSADALHCPVVYCDEFAIASSARSLIALMISLCHLCQRLNALAATIYLITTDVNGFISDGIIPDKWR